MAKTKKTIVSLSPDDMDRIQRRNNAMELIRDKDYEIIKADLKDDICTFKYCILEGVGAGRVHSVNDSIHISEPQLRKAFEKFKVHMAVISGAFADSQIEIDDIDKFHEHDITELFTVTGFEVHGTEDDPKIKLVGNKYVSVSRGRIDIKTHKVPMDNLGGYQWYYELKQAADDACMEVALYKEGYYEPLPEDEEEDADQTKMNLFGGDQPAITDNEFETGKV